MILNVGVPRTATVYVQETLTPVRPHGHYHFTASDWSYSAFQPIPEEWEGDYKVGFVRNPFDLLVSHWCLLQRFDVVMQRHHIGSALLDFRDWVTLVAHRRHRYPQRYPLFFQLFHDDWSIGVDYLGRYETLDDDLAAIAGITGATYEPGDRVNASTRDVDWHAYYDEPIYRTVEEAWGPELAYFGYDREGPTGKTLTTYGQCPRPTHLRVEEDTP